MIVNRGNIMGLLKEKLQSLNNSQIHTLWDYWIQQNLASPNEKQMIDALSDMVDADPVAEAELLSDIADIDNLCKLEPKADNTKLLNFLKEQYTEYQENVLPLTPDGSSDDDDYRTFDEAKNEFLESLWDVVQQHFDDVNEDPIAKRFEFTITLSGQGNCADGAWIDAVNAFALDPGTPNSEQTKNC